MKLEKISKKQQEIFDFMRDDENNILICDGAVRSGKTICMTIAFVLWAMLNFDSTNFAICGKTVGSVERNVIAPFLAVDGFGNKASYHRSERYLSFTVNGRKNRFYVFGGKDESSYQLIQGITLAGVLFDEVALQPRSFVQQAEARTLTYSNKKIWYNCNPEGLMHWFNQEFIVPADKGIRKGVRHLHFLMSDNPIVSESQIKEAEEMFSGVFYQRYILGLWVMSEGLIYDMFNESIHVIDEEPETEGDWWVSCDFGIQNATVFQLWRKIKDTDEHLCVDEWYYSGRDERRQKSVSELVDGLEQMLDGRMPRRVIIDPSAAALKVELKQRGYRTQDADNDVLDGISDVSTLLTKRKIFFMRRCKSTIEEFGQYIWDAKAADRGVDVPVKQSDHGMDSLRYYVRTRKLVKHNNAKPYKSPFF